MSLRQRCSLVHSPFAIAVLAIAAAYPWLFCKTVSAGFSVTVSSSYGNVATDAGGGSYEAFPDVTRLNDGRLMSVFYEGYTHISTPNTTYPNGGRIAYATSSDEGRTWNAAKTLCDTPQDDRDPSITQLPNGKLLCTYFTYANGQTQGVYLTQSSDLGTTWSSPSLLVMTPYAVSSPVRRLAGGRLALGLYSEGGGVAHGAVALSDDSGTTWTTANIPNTSGAYLDAETDLIELKNGNLWAIERSSNSPARYSLSTDLGQTWSDSQSLGFVAHCPYLLRTTHDSMILMGYRAFDANGNGYTALRYSLDECATWSDPITVDANCVGAYPSMVNLSDGSVLMTYYEEGNGSNIRYRTIEITGLPEPSSVMILATALVGLVVFAWQKQRQFVKT